MPDRCLYVSDSSWLRPHARLMAFKPLLMAQIDLVMLLSFSLSFFFKPTGCGNSQHHAGSSHNQFVPLIA